MILKFRETHIDNMEKRPRAQTPEETGYEQQEAIVVSPARGREREREGGRRPTRVSSCLVLLLQKLLQQEIEQLKYKIDHHPDITKFAMENLDLRGTCKNLSTKHFIHTV